MVLFVTTLCDIAIFCSFNSFFFFLFITLYSGVDQKLSNQLVKFENQS